MMPPSPGVQAFPPKRSFSIVAGNSDVAFTLGPPSGLTSSVSTRTPSGELKKRPRTMPETIEPAAGGTFMSG